MRMWKYLCTTNKAVGPGRMMKMMMRPLYRALKGHFIECMVGGILNALHTSDWLERAMYTGQVYACIWQNLSTQRPQRKSTIPRKYSNVSTTHMSKVFLIIIKDRKYMRSMERKKRQ